MQQVVVVEGGCSRLLPFVRGRQGGTTMAIKDSPRRQRTTGGKGKLKSMVPTSSYRWMRDERPVSPSCLHMHVVTSVHLLLLVILIGNLPRGGHSLAYIPRLTGLRWEMGLAGWLAGQRKRGHKQITASTKATKEGDR